MTDLLTRLAALTAIDKNGLLPCAICGHPNEVDGIKPTLESNRRRVVCTHCGMTTIWCDSASHAIQLANDRPRETTLIALVQKAAGEIERLTALLDKFFFAQAAFDHGDDVRHMLLFREASEENADWRISAANPQESTVA